MKILCGRCRKPVSTEVPEKTIVMAWIECPDCLRKKNKNRSDINNSYTINIMDAEKIDQALRCESINAIKENIMTERDVFSPPIDDFFGEYNLMCDFCGKENKIGYTKNAPPGSIVIGTIPGSIWVCDNCDKKYDTEDIDIALVVKTNIRNNLVKFLQQELCCIAPEMQIEMKKWIIKTNKILKRKENKP